MMKMVYQWGSRGPRHIDPQVVGETIADIESREGRCAPSSLVNAAREESSPLHPLFTWDDVDAAERWQTHQARNLINALVVTVKRGSDVVESPAFISVGHAKATIASGEGYRSLSVVVENQDFAEEALSEALSKLKALQARYAAIEKLAPVWLAIEQAIAA